MGMKHILVASDLTDRSERALGRALQLTIPFRTAYASPCRYRRIAGRSPDRTTTNSRCLC